MTVERKRTETVYAIFRELVESGRAAVRPGDVNTVLRDRGLPLDTWEVRREFTRIEAQGLITCDATTGLWHLAGNDAAASDAAAKKAG